MATRRIAAILIAVLAANLAVSGVRFFLSVETGSSGILADAFHALSDSAANVVALVALWIAARPPHAEHPYGHRRFETAAVLTIGFLILLAAFEAGREAVTRLASGTRPQFSQDAFLLLAATLASSIFIAFTERSFGKRYGSELLLADAKHTVTDVFSAIAVLLGFGAVALGMPIFDPIAALAIVVVIGWTGFTLIWPNIQILVNSAAFTETEIRREVLAVAGVRTCHRIRSFGPTEEPHIDVHILVDAASPFAAETITHAVIARLRQRFLADVTVQHEQIAGCPDDAPA